MKIRLREDKPNVKVGDVIVFKNGTRVLIVEALNDHYRGLTLHDLKLSESRVTITDLTAMLKRLYGNIIRVVDGDNLELVEK